MNTKFVSWTVCAEGPAEFLGQVSQALAPLSTLLLATLACSCPALHDLLPVC